MKQAEEVVLGRRLRIEGKVQGVGFRASFQEIAHQLRLKGWVRNTDDGAVEACVCATGEDAQARLLEAMRFASRGPSLAEVKLLKIIELGPTELTDLLDAGNLIDFDGLQVVSRPEGSDLKKEKGPR